MPIPSLHAEGRIDRVISARALSAIAGPGRSRPRAALNNSASRAWLRPAAARRNIVRCQLLNQRHGQLVFRLELDDFLQLLHWGVFAAEDQVVISPGEESIGLIGVVL